MMTIAGAEGRGDRPVRRRSRFTLAGARAEPLALDARGTVRFVVKVDRMNVSVSITGHDTLLQRGRSLKKASPVPR